MKEIYLVEEWVAGTKACFTTEQAARNYLKALNTHNYEENDYFLDNDEYGIYKIAIDIPFDKNKWDNAEYFEEI